MMRRKDDSLHARVDDLDALTRSVMVGAASVIGSQFAGDPKLRAIHGYTMLAAHVIEVIVAMSPDHARDLIGLWIDEAEDRHRIRDVDVDALFRAYDRVGPKFHEQALQRRELLGTAPKGRA